MTSTCFSSVYMLKRFLSKQDRPIFAHIVHGRAIANNMHHVYKIKASAVKCCLDRLY